MLRRARVLSFPHYVKSVFPSVVRSPHCHSEVRRTGAGGRPPVGVAICTKFKKRGESNTGKGKPSKQTLWKELRTSPLPMLPGPGLAANWHLIPYSGGDKTAGLLTPMASRRTALGWNESSKQQPCTNPLSFLSRKTSTAWRWGPPSLGRDSAKAQSHWAAVGGV